MDLTIDHISREVSKSLTELKNEGFPNFLSQVDSLRAKRGLLPLKSPETVDRVQEKPHNDETGTTDTENALKRAPGSGVLATDLHTDDDGMQTQVASIDNRSKAQTKPAQLGQDKTGQDLRGRG